MNKLGNLTLKSMFWISASSASLIAMSSAQINAQTNSQTTQNNTDSSEEDVGIVVTGIRASLETALAEKRESTNIVEVIQAEDIGKLPDQNLAEVLENVTGVQITRSAGVGSAVQIRGTADNRVEINGVSTVGAGAGRSGISFEDLPAAVISSVEVTKVPNAKIIEGSVGGTINLRTIRPLNLPDPIISFRAQGEYSDLSDTFLPRFSGTVGNSWFTGIGEIGAVISASYARQDVASFNPRVDRDAVVLPDSGRASAEDFPFLRIQFFDQELINFEFETYNITGALEWAPTDNLTFSFDGIYNDQTRSQESTRVQISGVSTNPVVDNTTNTSFETINFGSTLGPNGPIDLGSVQAVLTGILEPGTNTSGSLDPNLRTSSNTGSRLTDSAVFRLGAEWIKDKLTINVEGSISTSDTDSPNFSTTLDFINPNSLQPSLGISLDNGVPVEFDVRGDTLQFGIAQGLATTPTTSQLLDPANYELRQVAQGASIFENRESAARVDISYDTTDLGTFFTSFDLGYRYNRNTSLNDDFTNNTNLTSATSSFNRPSADQFASLIIPGPNNFDAADGRTLFFPDFLIIDGQQAFDDQQGALDAINAAITSNNALTDGIDVPLIGPPTQSASGFFEIAETTNAVYLQANFETEDLGVLIRGNAGVRWVSTDLTSIGNNITNGAADGQIIANSSYNFFLPRFNLVIEPAEDILLRAGIARDLRRPAFNTLSTSLAFGGGATNAVQAGNPNLVPETVWSYDLSAEYYFAQGSVFSVGFFHKVRTNLFAESINFPAQNLINGQLNVDITPPCESGGIFNPIADRNINNPVQGFGICVPLASTFNVDGSTTQTGIELGFQHDLSAYENTLGFASGFGFIGNFTYQETGGSAQEFRPIGGPRDVFSELGILNAQQPVDLQDLSNFAFNTTIFYQKYGISARARYTWRSSFQNSTDNFAFGAPRVNGARGQLNSSINYDITENINIGIEGINLLREDANQFCVNNNTLLCFQGLTDRRITGGVTIRF